MGVTAFLDDLANTRAWVDNVIASEMVANCGARLISKRTTANADDACVVLRMELDASQVPMPPGFSAEANAAAMRAGMVMACLLRYKLIDEHHVDLQAAYRDGRVRLRLAVQSHGAEEQAFELARGALGLEQAHLDSPVVLRRSGEVGTLRSFADGRLIVRTAQPAASTLPNETRWEPPENVECLAAEELWDGDDAADADYAFPEALVRVDDEVDDAIGEAVPTEDEPGVPAGDGEETPAECPAVTADHWRDYFGLSDAEALITRAQAAVRGFLQRKRSRPAECSRVSRAGVTAMTKRCRATSEASGASYAVQLALGL